MVVHCRQTQHRDAMTLIKTDAASQVVLPGHPEQTFAMRENSDGSILLLPAKLVTVAQLEYDQTPELRDLLARAAASSTVLRTPKEQPSDSDTSVDGPL